MNLSNLKIDVYSDGADIKDMKEMAKLNFVTGFTTNPSLMKSAGVEDYLTFAKEVVKEFPDKSLSFEVFSNDFETMEKEAQVIHQLGSNIYVKIPIITADGESTAPLIKKLSDQGIFINVTAIATIDQVNDCVAAFAPGTKNLVSVFAGRVADTGTDPTEFVKQSAEICGPVKEAYLLWASTREVINVFQAQELGCDIITVPPSILKKLSKIGKSQLDVSLDTVRGFARDIQSLGYSILS
ncbi:transaldolase [Sporolactobacillus terrae]|uniref:transaldolase n=1 Tax=Sporolactobacillus terrae TaxID=269673 RepID=UPI001119D830|nr:transaldolase [Sporolactobacillus terrae]UAK16395.1 transaldolase [Sporolactobacillus terrae]